MEGKKNQDQLSFREIDFKNDLDKILVLIKTDLDENYDREFFIWKHLKNPFGKSYVMVVWDKQKIVALRCFMYWDFYDSILNRVVRSIRPVDTVVDSSYRGKGLFKRMTLQGLENCKNNFELVFNTPNSNSLPGYLKMGWKKIDEIHNFKLGLFNPFFKTVPINLIQIKDLKKTHIQFNSGSLIKTNITKEFLIWRYSISNYLAAECDNASIIYSITKIYGLETIVIHELLGDSKYFNNLLVTLSRKIRVYFAYYYNSESLREISFLFTINRKDAVVVSKDDDLNIAKNISFSLGDLEGKL